MARETIGFSSHYWLEWRLTLRATWDHLNDFPAILEVVKEAVMGMMIYFFDHETFEKSMNISCVPLMPKMRGAGSAD